MILKHDGKDYPWWILTTTHRKNPVDELALWCLCKMTFQHAVVYTPGHTWPTLKDKHMTIEEIDKVCDLHFAYMGYGKFARIRPVNNTVSMTNVLPTMQTLTSNMPTALEEPLKTPITRNRHGLHPSHTTSAHINYFNLNQGQDTSDKKSPRIRKKKSTTEWTLREPTTSCIAAQSHITQTRDTRRSIAEKPEDELTVVAMLSSDEDGHTIYPTTRHQRSSHRYSSETRISKRIRTHKRI